MGLLFEGDSGFDLAGPPEWTETTFGLDSLVIPYQGKYSDLAAFLAAHAVSEVSPEDSNMFLMLKLPDGHKQFPTVRMSYQGKRGGVLPPPQNEFDSDRLSASSKRSKLGIILTEPLIVEYYAPTSIYTTYSRTPEFNAAPDPQGGPQPITLTSFDTTVSITGPVGAAIAMYFQPQIITTNKATELVPGQWWRNVNKKTNLLSPWIFDVPSGPFGSIASPGIEYRAGDHVTFSRGGKSMSITVTAVFVAWGEPGQGGIVSFTQTFNNFTTNQTLVPGFGGSGRDALMNITMIP